MTATWGGEGVQVDPEPVRDVVGHAGDDVGDAASPGPEGEPGLAAAALLLAEQQLLLVTVGHLGRHHLEHPTAEDA